MSDWAFRMAEPSDAPAFSRWAAENRQIEAKDIWAGTKKKNPTVLVFAITKDGIPVAFAPVYLQFTVAHLAFDPEANERDKLRSLHMLTDGVSALAVQYGIREITTLSKEEYPVAQWAMKNGFELESRQLLKMDLNKILEVATVEEKET